METRELILEIREAELLSRAGADELSEKYGDMDPARVIAKLFTQLKAARHQAEHYKGVCGIQAEKIEALECGIDVMGS